MRLLKFFCFKWTIATGAEVAGYLNLLEVLFLITFYLLLDMYAFISLIVLPIGCFAVFHKMMKKDSVKARRKTFLCYLIAICIIDGI